MPGVWDFQAESAAYPSSSQALSSNTSACAGRDPRPSCLLLAVESGRQPKPAPLTSAEAFHQHCPDGPAAMPASVAGAKENPLRAL